MVISAGVAVLVVHLLGCSGPTEVAEEFPEPIVFNDDAGWCWFQDERTIVWEGALWVGSVAAGVDDGARRGDIDLMRYDLTTGVSRRIELHDRLQRDDHDAPALLPLESGELLAVYARHGSDKSVRTRRVAVDGSLVGEEQTLEPPVSSGHGVTYANVFRLADENDGDGRIYDFFRGEGWDPNVIVSDDDGQTWRRMGQLLAGPGRPYVRYASNGSDTVHFFCTDQHPRDFDNSLYYGFVRDGGVWAGEGKRIGTLGEDVPTHEQLTRVFQGRPDAVAWPCDVELDAQQNPCVVYTVQVDGAGLPPGKGGMDHRFRFARFDGTAWHDEQIAFAGTRLYAGEDDYTGLATIDPCDTSVVYISTDADPVTGEPLVSAADGQRHRELFRGRRFEEGDGEAWEWTAITRDSLADNVRPLVSKAAIGSGDEAVGGVRALLWLRGKMTSYTDYDFDAVGYLLSGAEGTHLTFGADRVRVEAGDELFTEFVFAGGSDEDGAVRRPYLYPVLGPGQTPMTRDYPVGESDRVEAHDHPHHTSMWFAHGDVNGEDLWTLQGSFELTGAVVPTERGLAAEYRKLGKAGDAVGLFTLELGFDVSEPDACRSIDSVCTFRPMPGHSLRLGDTKEGTFAIRTHPALRLVGDARAGVKAVSGQAINSEGVTGAAVWGKRAAWVDYSGQIGGREVGVAIFDHPSNPRHPTWWHARDYGLVAANPFGIAEFEHRPAGAGDMTIEPGGAVRFEHRFVFHAGNTEQADVPALYAAWARETEPQENNR